MKTIFLFRRFVPVLAALALAGLVLTSCAYQSTPNHLATDSDEALANWHNARYFQAQGRYELAREHYLLALAAARTDDVRNALGQELYAVDLQIKTLR